MEISQEAPADDPWPGYFAGRGHPGALRIGSGAEGVVYRLGPGRVAKVWAGRPPIELTRRVYTDLARHRLPFATPEIFEVVEHEGGRPARRQADRAGPRPGRTGLLRPRPRA
ncbi:hypothetical protein AB0J43_58270, partial [Nonomuraea fuscirosea]